MPRARTKITQKNFYSFFIYFSNGIKRTSRLWKLLKDPAMATLEFKDISDEYYRTSQKDTGELFTNKLQKWVDTYLSKEAWDRCIIARRQEKFHRENRRYPIKLDVDAYIKLQEYAKVAGLTLAKAVYQASSVALSLSKECKK